MQERHKKQTLSRHSDLKQASIALRTVCRYLLYALTNPIISTLTFTDVSAVVSPQATRAPRFPRRELTPRSTIPGAYGDCEYTLTVHIGSGGESTAPLDTHISAQPRVQHGPGRGLRVKSLRLVRASCQLRMSFPARLSKLTIRGKRLGSKNNYPAYSQHVRKSQQTRIAENRGVEIQIDVFGR